MHTFGKEGSQDIRWVVRQLTEQREGYITHEVGETTELTGDVWMRVTGGTDRCL